VDTSGGAHEEEDDEEEEEGLSPAYKRQREDSPYLPSSWSVDTPQRGLSSFGREDSSQRHHHHHHHHSLLGSPFFLREESIGKEREEEEERGGRTGGKEGEEEEEGGVEEKKKSGVRKIEEEEEEVKFLAPASSKPLYSSKLSEDSLRFDFNSYLSDLPSPGREMAEEQEDEQKRRSSRLSRKEEADASVSGTPAYLRRTSSLNERINVASAMCDLSSPLVSRLKPSGSSGSLGGDTPSVLVHRTPPPSSSSVTLASSSQSTTSLLSSDEASASSSSSSRGVRRARRNSITLDEDFKEELQTERRIKKEEEEEEGGELACKIVAPSAFSFSLSSSSSTPPSSGNSSTTSSTSMADAPSYYSLDVHPSFNQNSFASQMVVHDGFTSSTSLFTPSNHTSFFAESPPHVSLKISPPPSTLPSTKAVTPGSSANKRKGKHPKRSPGKFHF
jgi:hypothetical protein